MTKICDDSNNIKEFDTYIDNNTVYGRIKFTEKRIDGIYDVYIPKFLICELADVHFTFGKERINIGTYNFDLCPGNYHDFDPSLDVSGDYLYMEKLARKKVRRMSKEDIEKELGYCIEIITEGEKIK